MGLSPRRAFERDIKPYLPKRWRIIPYTTNLDVLSTTTVIVQMTGIQKSAAAPLASFDIDFDVYVVGVHVDPEKGEDETDDEFLTFLAALDGARIPWRRAEKGPYSDSTPNLAWKFTIPFTAEKEQTNGN